MSKLFHLWIPELFHSKGGIQVFSGFLIRAIQTIYPDAHYSIFIKNDLPMDIVHGFPNTTTQGFGHWSGKLRTIIFSVVLILQAIRQKPNLIITTHINFIPAARLLKKITGIPFWAIAHGVEAWGIEDHQVKKALHDADQILAVSNYTRDRLIKEENLNPHKIVVLPNTFDPSHLQVGGKPAHLLTKFNLKPEQKVILTVGRLAEQKRYKGYDQVLEALPQVLKVFPDLRYIIGGKGKDRPRIEQIISRLKLEPWVIFAGFIPDAELADYYNLSDVLAMPSKREGFGIVFIEALACGRPVIGGTLDGAVDALDGGRLGALVDPDNIDEIAQTIIQILAKDYTHPLIYEPDQLRQEVIKTFGFSRFTEILAQYLHDANL